MNLVHPFQAMGSRPAALESGRVESPPSVDFDPVVPSQKTVGAYLLKLTHEAFERIIPLGLENPLMFPRQHACPELRWHVISFGTWFGRRSRFRGTGGGVTSFVHWSEGSSTGCERESATLGERCRSINFSSCGPWRRIPGTATTLWSKTFGRRASTHSHGFKPSFVILVSWTTFSHLQIPRWQCYRLLPPLPLIIIANFFLHLL